MYASSKAESDDWIKVIQWKMVIPTCTCIIQQFYNKQFKRVYLIGYISKIEPINIYVTSIYIRAVR